MGVETLAATGDVARKSFFRDWICTVDHKKIGIMYALTSLIFFFFGGLAAILIRTQLAMPEGQVLDPQQFNQAFTVHGTIMVFLWMSLNIIAYVWHWDPFPFILLNLLFSTQAAYAAPVIMMAQNRQSDRDRLHAEEDYETNRKAKAEIEELQRRLNSIETDKLDKILALLEKQL